tara:strand:- start:278 stop:409 length:132 start_codon:yes stop_codon:yes gene_type:complete
MKSLTIFGLLIYWSIIITAPVVSNDKSFDKSARIIKPLKKPLN